MNRRLVTLAAAGLAAAIALAGAGTASADPPGQPGTPPAGKTPAQIYSTRRRRRVRRADQQPRDRSTTRRATGTRPGPGVVRRGQPGDRRLGGREHHSPRPAAPVAPPERRQRRHHGDHAQPEEHGRHRTSTASTACAPAGPRARPPAEAEPDVLRAEPGRGQLRGDRQRLRADDAADHRAAEGHLRVHDDRLEPGRRPGRRDPPVPPAGLRGDANVLPPGDRHAASTNVSAGCTGLPTVFDGQQNDGRSMNGDPQGIAPYAVTKWAAQDNEPPGINDYRGGAHIGTGQHHARRRPSRPRSTA